MNAAQDLFDSLHHDFCLAGATGRISFALKDFTITVEQNNVVGNTIEEWLSKWMTSRGILHRHNDQQAAPDFWLDPSDLESNWLEVKSFYQSPGFDVAAFRSFVNQVIDQPWKLHSQFLLIKYSSKNGLITIERFWLKNLWEICCTSATWPLKVQYKNKVIFNIRPATWYADDPTFHPFYSLEHFLAALEETIYRYRDTRTTIAETWSERLCASYYRKYGVSLVIPRWNDKKHIYLPPKQ